MFVACAAGSCDESKFADFCTRRDVTELSLYKLSFKFIHYPTGKPHPLASEPDITAPFHEAYAAVSTTNVTLEVVGTYMFVLIRSIISPFAVLNWRTGKMVKVRPGLIHQKKFTASDVSNVERHIPTQLAPFLPTPFPHAFHAIQLLVPQIRNRGHRRA